jgi:hypothetical protein
MSWELEQERELFLKALNNAIAWQNRCVHLYEIIELMCLDAEEKLKEAAND